MDRNREVRRVPMVTPNNGIPRRRHRPSSLRDSPEDDGPLELQETARFRDRSVKKDRDREKERSDRERLERERDRDRLSRNKRRRGDKYVHGSNREDGMDDSSEGSINDEDEEDPDDAPLRVMPPNPVSVSSSSSPSSALTSSRKSFPPAGKVFRAAPSWKTADEIGFSVPRKARSASTKRFHDCWSSAGVAGESVVLQASPSPVRPSTAASPAVASPSPAPVSPTSSNLSVKKKIKANGPKQRPPKSTAKSPPSVQDDIEIEVAEVLYGLMRQSQAPPKQEMVSNGSAKYDPREVNRSTVDSKSRAASPISNSGSAPAQNPLGIHQNSSNSVAPLFALAPKRKRPRPVCQSEEIPAGFARRSSPISTDPKIEPELQAKQEVRSPTPDKNSTSAAVNGGAPFDLVKPHGSHPTVEPVLLTPATGVSSSDDKRSSAVDQLLGKITETIRKVEDVPSPKKESVDDRVDCTSSQPITAATTGEKESRREERLEIDLMAPPPQSRSSPERERESEVVQHHEPMARDGDAELKSKRVDAGRTNSAENADMKTEVVDKLSMFSVAGGEEGETQKPNHKKAKTIDLRLDLDRSGVPDGADDSKLNPQLSLKQQQPLKTSKDDTSTNKTAQGGSLPVPMSVPAGWPTGLPPMGYVAPLQGVVSIDGRTMAPTAIQPPHFLFTQPRPGKCATHCYIAKNIFSHQQFMKNYPYWPTPAGAASLFSGKPYNLNAAPTTDAVRGGDVNHVQDKGQTLSFFPGQQPAAKDKGAQLAINPVDNAQKKQLYQSLPPGVPSNMMHGPTPVFFPLGQQQVATAASGGPAASRTSSTKSPTLTGTAASVSVSTAALNASVAPGQATPATMSFNYPSMGANETQYLAILANGAYQFPIPAHVGAGQAYRGPHPQVMPFFNGSYYSSQMLHPSQLQQQQQAPPSQSVQMQQNHQNPSISASSSSQKHSQNQQQKPQGNNTSVAASNPTSQTYAAPKSHASQAQHPEKGREGSQSATDTRSPHPPNMNVYGQNFTLPFNPASFALMTPPASLSGATASVGANGNHGEKQQQQPQAFAMSFAPMNGATTPGFDITSMSQNHAFMQSLPEPIRSNYHMMAAQAAQQKKNYEDSKPRPSGPSNGDEERKRSSSKAPALSGQSIAFSRPDMVEAAVSSVPGNNVVDSSARSLNLAPGAVHSSQPSASNSMSNVAPPTSQQQHFMQLQMQQHQLAQHQLAVAANRNKAPGTSNGAPASNATSNATAPSSQQQQFMQLQMQQQQIQHQHQIQHQQQMQQQQIAAAANRNKAPAASNGIAYSDHLSSASAIAAKLPNASSGFQHGTCPPQSRQWKFSGITTPSQGTSPTRTSAADASAEFPHGACPPQSRPWKFSGITTPSQVTSPTRTSAADASSEFPHGTCPPQSRPWKFSGITTPSQVTSPTRTPAPNASSEFPHGTTPPQSRPWKFSGIPNSQVNSTIGSSSPSASSGAFPQRSAPVQSRQWKFTGITTPPHITSPTRSSASTTTSMKNLAQHQGRTHIVHTQISFGGNPKSSTAPQGQQAPNFAQSPSPPVMVGSPSTSSVSKGQGGSPRMTTSSSTSNKPSQPGRHSPSLPSQSSSPVSAAGRNSPSVFGGKPQMQHQSQQLSQPQLSKQSIQQAQMFFNSPYMQSSSVTSAASTAGGFQLQRHRPEQQQQQPSSKSQGAPTATFSSGMLSLSTSDSSKTETASAGNKKGAMQQQQAALHAAQYSTQASAYAHSASAAAAAQVKPAEQKQPAGNDNLHARSQPEKK